MARDSQTKLSKREQLKRNKKQIELAQKKKKNNSSDNDSYDESDSDNEEMDIHEYRKFISKIFPSKYIDKNEALYYLCRHLMQFLYNFYIPTTSHY